MGFPEQFDFEEDFQENSIKPQINNWCFEWNKMNVPIYYSIQQLFQFEQV